MTDKAIVLFSGGQDSTTCLAWALERFDHVETLGFDYRQRHAVELQQRNIVIARMRDLSPAWSAKLGEDHLLDLGVLSQVSDTALTRDVEIIADAQGLPNTFVPGRNLLFMTFAAALAWRRGVKHIIGGMCETDFSGYPDCRDDAIKALQVALNIGMDQRFVLHTPLMWLDKAATWALSAELGGTAFVDLIREHSHTCYHGDRQNRHDWGYGCGTCPACDLRAKGWQAWRAASVAASGDRSTR